VLRSRRVLTVCVAVLALFTPFLISVSDKNIGESAVGSKFVKSLEETNRNIDFDTSKTNSDIIISNTAVQQYESIAFVPGKTIPLQQPCPSLMTMLPKQGPLSRWWGGGRYTGTPKNIVIHTTESGLRKGSAKAVASWLSRTEYKASAHYVIDADETLSIVDLEDTAWGVGGGPQNSSGVQLELVGRASTTRDDWLNGLEHKVLCRAAAITALLAYTYEIPLRRVEAHGLNDLISGVAGHSAYTTAFGISTHTDPGIEFPWDAFLAQSAQYLEAASQHGPLSEDIHKPDRPLSSGSENSGQPLPEFGNVVKSLDKITELLKDLSSMVGIAANPKIDVKSLPESNKKDNISSEKASKTIEEENTP